MCAQTKSDQESKKPRRALLGKKIGMTQAYSEGGEWVPVTVIQAGPCTVLQVKSEKSDGYAAVQLGFDDTHKPRKRPQQAYLEKIGVSPKRFVKEVPLADPKAFAGKTSTGKTSTGKEGEGAEEGGPEGSGDVAGPSAGATVGVTLFKDVKSVDVRGVTKGRGFAGVIRRYHCRE